MSGQQITTAAERLTGTVVGAQFIREGTTSCYCDDGCGCSCCVDAIDSPGEYITVRLDGENRIAGGKVVITREGQQPTAQPTVEAVAEALYLQQYPESGLWNFVGWEIRQRPWLDMARAVLALLPGRPESVVKAEADLKPVALPSWCPACDGLGFMAYGANTGMPCGDCDGSGER